MAREHSPGIAKVFQNVRIKNAVQALSRNVRKLQLLSVPDQELRIVLLSEGREPLVDFDADQCIHAPISEQFARLSARASHFHD
jgi:hypothetical protein